MLLSSLTAAAILAPGSFSSPGAMFIHKGPRTNVSTTERLDAVYRPGLPVDARYESWFQPTRITLANGELNPLLEDDALATRYKSHQKQPLAAKSA